MLGWDVGYIWPLLESVVTPQSRDTRQLVMGNPREANQSGASGETSSNRVISPPPPPTPEATLQVNPPPYENVDIGEPNASHHLNSPTVSQSVSDRRSHSQRTRLGNSTVHWVRPPKWPHKASSLFACLGCVMGICNISRFAMLVYIFKGCFIFQFLFLSCLFGIPFLYIQMSLGQYLGAGMLDMWYISPAFKGIGFAMLYLYIILGVYNAIPLSWLFIFFKDSFITLKDSYKWGRCQYGFARSNCLRALNSSSSDFYGWSVPSYFHGRVLGRKQDEFQLGELKFEVAFNLCLVWIIVFVCLSRGPKTFGKVVYLFAMLPISLLVMVTLRMGQQWSTGIVEIFSSPWKPVLMNSSAWMLAARETFITWGLLGIVALHICSHNKVSTNISRNLIAIAITATSVLIMSSFLFVSSINALNRRNLSYAFSSYEDETSVKVLKSGLVYDKNISVMSLIFGVSVVPKDSFLFQSGYQVLRLITEAFPAALAVEGVRSISSFWSICFYTSMIFFGFGQQIVIWYCVVESVISVNFKVFNAWHTTLTFITCNLAFLLGLPITSNIGIFIIYYLDFTISSLWWIVLMYFIMLLVVAFIRGNPGYGIEQLVNVIIRNPSRRAKLMPFFTIMWNIVLPLCLVCVSAIFLQTSSMDPNSEMGSLMDQYQYWPQWAKTLNLCCQMFPIIIICTVSAYYILRVLFDKSDKPVKERLKVVLCPSVPIPPVSSRHSILSSISHGSTNSGFLEQEDPPPKYTPPPSYSTATSRMIAKQLDLQRQQEHCLALNFESLDVRAIGDGVSPTSLMDRILPQSRS